LSLNHGDESECANDCYRKHSNNLFHSLSSTIKILLQAATVAADPHKFQPGNLFFVSVNIDAQRVPKLQTFRTWRSDSHL